MWGCRGPYRLLFVSLHPPARMAPSRASSRIQPRRGPSASSHLLTVLSRLSRLLWKLPSL